MFIFNCIFILGYEQQEVALNCGAMLRECIRFEALAKIVLHSPHFFDFFKYVEVSTFDIASDAFATFKVNKLWIVKYIFKKLSQGSLYGLHVG